MKIINISSDFENPDEYLSFHHDTADTSLSINEKAIKKEPIKAKARFIHCEFHFAIGFQKQSKCQISDTKIGTKKQSTKLLSGMQNLEQ